MSTVASGYGQALYELACEEGLQDSVLKQIEILSDAFVKDPAYLRLLSTPELSKQERCKIVDDSFRESVHAYVLNFLKLLTEKGYAKTFPQCVSAYRERYNTDNGIISVQAVTAVALTEDQCQRLCRKLQKVTGKQIQLCNRVDPSCLGGVRLDFDGKRLDGTVRNRLENLAAMLNRSVL